MQKTYIFGHRNPDTDSVCAPYCYAWLKRQTEPQRVFLAGVLGNPNPQTRFVFQHLGLEIPPLLRDVYPKAEDLMLRDLHTVKENDPIGLVTALMDERKVRNVPVVDDTGCYSGMITMYEIAHYFMPRQYDTRPNYHLRPENIDRVMPGYYLQRGETEEMHLPLMVGAMAYETFMQRLEAILAKGGDYPLLIVGNRPEIISYVLTHDFPVLILTGMKDTDCCELDLSGFKGWIFVSEADTAETIRLLRISIPAKALANRDLPVIAPQDNLDSIKRILMKLDHHGVAVVEDCRLLGLVTSSRLIDHPRHRVIMMDHNETAHSVEGIDQADIVEIIDHHKLDTIRSSKPIYVYSDPLGSTCTLVYNLYRPKGIAPPPEIAALLLSGILSDTLILRSPTTTEEDVSAAQKLAEIANMDIQEWGSEIFRQAASLRILEPDTATLQDFKIYKEEGWKVGISQIEVITLKDLDEVKNALLEALSRVRAKFSLDWALLLITDISAGESMLLSTEFRFAADLVYHRVDAHTFHLPDVLSRKKQLLPEVLFALRGK